MARAYYNEIDPYCVEWLRALIAAGHIAPGDVDSRDIRDVRPDDLAGYDQCHFFAGLGGWSRALRLAGVPDDAKLWTGSCPCQPFSAAGKRKGFADERHLWPCWHWLIEKRCPPVVFGEQVASATEWLRLVRGDLEALGYAVGAAPIEAASAGADHLRDRFWFVADADFAGSQGRIVLSERAGERVAGADGVAGDLGHALGERAGRDGRGGAGAEAQGGGERRADGRLGDTPGASGAELEWVIGADGKARRVKSGIRLLADRVPARVAKLRAFGNAIDPRPAAEFIRACGG